MREARIFAGVFAVATLALGGFSCDKKSVAQTPDPGPSVPFEKPPSAPTPTTKPTEAPAPTPAPAPPPPSNAQKVSELSDKLPSPCGKAESLTKAEADPTCKSAPFAKRFVEKLVSLEAPDEDLQRLYKERFAARDKPSFNLRETAFIGSPTAPVTVVEFFDYGCPHCREAEPLLEKLVQEHPRDVAVYFKMYPLRKETMDAARASMAAQRQGKFSEMNRVLFANQGRQSREEIGGYAKEMGLDMARFDKDMNDPSINARIEADRAEAAKAKLEGTPMIWENGRRYHNMFQIDPISDWVEEDLALNP